LPGDQAGRARAARAAGPRQSGGAQAQVPLTELVRCSVEPQRRCDHASGAAHEHHRRDRAPHRGGRRGARPGR
jgi:hypothetical protein